MSVGDNKGSRRRFKLRQQAGHAPRASGMSVGKMIERNKVMAMRMAAAASKRSK